MGEGGRTGSYRLLFLTDAQKDSFVSLKSEDNKLDDWMNYTGKLTEKLFNEVKHQSYAAIGEENVESFPTWGASGIHETSYVLLFVTGGGMELSRSNHLLEPRKDLVCWPYWSDGTITVSNDGIRIGSPRSSQGNEAK